MKAFSKEFYELVENFEKNIKKHHSISVDLTRSPSDIGETKIHIGGFYNNGRTSELFEMYMLGYSFGIIQN